jgi:hypothetical protein
VTAVDLTRTTEPTDSRSVVPRMTPTRRTGSPRRRLHRLGWQVGAIGTAAALTLGLTQAPSSGAFTARTDDLANSVVAAVSFCTSTGQTAVVLEDSSGYQGDPLTAYDTYPSLGVVSQNNQNTRAVMRFDMPPIPATCSLTSATLWLYATRSDPGAIVDVYRIAPAAGGWTAPGIRWGNLPATTGSGTPGGNPGVLGWQSWPVTTQVSGLYAEGNSGFLVRDRTDNASAGGRWQLYDSDNSPNKPRLVLTWN